MWGPAMVPATTGPNQVITGRCAKEIFAVGIGQVDGWAWAL
jgi:hypothetical protein